MLLEKYPQLQNTHRCRETFFCFCFLVVFFYLLDLFGESGLGKGENNDAITPTIFFGPNQNGKVKLDASCSKKPPRTIHEQPRDSAERLRGLTSSLSDRVLAKCTIYFAVSSLKSLRLTYNQMTDTHKQWHCVSGQFKAKVKVQQRFWKNDVNVQQNPERARVNASISLCTWLWLDGHSSSLNEPSDKLKSGFHNVRSHALSWLITDPSGQQSWRKRIH